MVKELREKLSEYIGFKPEQIRMPITAEDQDLLRKLIAQQEQITDIVIGEHQDLLRYRRNSKALELAPSSHKIAKKVSKKIREHPIGANYFSLCINMLIKPFIPQSSIYARIRFNFLVLCIRLCYLVLSNYESFLRTGEL
ncbi:3413_t:CDS:2 [Ambispora gerdemannii]|uniref:3413_t:CDS:1 n=1 Tax=Ambispora gerdemannii TaxID=144530 RepID=A0A9N8ZV09_9GLOM|nr:3413_t:CDS:2 [Ambispora gerdemannii]